MTNGYHVPRSLKKILDSFGIPWSIESGGKHNHVIMDGRRVAVFTRGLRDSGGRDCKDLACRIRRNLNRG